MALAREPSIYEVAEDLKDLTAEVQGLRDQFYNAPFVRADLHNEQVTNIKDQLAVLRTMLMAILGILGTLLVSGAVLVISAVARGGFG